jgi:phage-related minor tail protein
VADLKIQGEVVVDASQAESALDRVGSKAESMAAEVGQSAGQAGRAVDGIGDKADAGAQKFTRAEARMRDAIRKSTLELQQFGKTASEKLEFKLADKGLDASKFQPYLAELRKVEAAHQAASGTLDGMGMSAKATAAALRGVPAQFTDIVTALQGGQRPLTVLMQQGGQLKDMFGGVGAAARALGGYVLGLINPFTLAAAAVGAIALAYNQGSKEQDAFVKSIVTTGNISGVTAGQLGQYARAISSVAGTQSKAAETLAAFVAEGVRGGAMLEKYAQTAIEWEKATGQSVAKTAEQFASLQKDPLSSVLKLNEGTNFLTDSVYKQIKALDEQGRSADASKVAMDALNTAMESRSKTIEQNLGYIEGAWRGITSAAKKAWDAMLNVGRAETGASQLASLRETLDQRMQRGPINDMPSIRAAWEKGNEGLRKQIDLLAEQERMLRRGAEAESERNKQLAARIEFDKAGEQYLSKRARMEREIAKATNEAAAAGIGASELEQRIASIREKFAEKNTEAMKAQRAAAKLLAEDMAALAKMAGLSHDFYKEWDKLNDMFKRGKLDVEGLTKAQAELLKKQPVIAAETKAQAEAQKQVNASIDAYRSALQAVAKEEAARVDGIAKSNADLREQIATMGLTNQQIRARTIELNRATIAEKEQQLARLQTGYTNTREQAALEEEIRLLKERNGLLSDQGVKEQYVAAQQEITDTWVSIDRTAHDTFVNIFEDGAGTFKRLGQTLKAALLDMLYQMTVKRWIINIGASMGATGGIFAAGNAVAGQGGSALGLLGNASSIAGNWGAISGWAGGGMSTANAAGSIFANATGTGIDGLLATNGAYGTAAGGGFMSGLATAAPWIAGGLLVANALGLFRTTERKGGGLVGTLGQAGGVHDVDLMRKGGTLFSGPDWFTEDLGVSKLDKIIQTQFDASKAAIKGFAETLGLSTEKIDGFTTALGTQTMGDHGQLGIRLDKDGKPLSDQEVQAAIAEAIKAGSNELAQLLIGTWTETTRTVQRQVVENMGATLSDYGGGGGYASRTVTEQVTDRTYKPSEFAREGEQAIDTLTRLATSLGTVNGIFDTLGLTLYETSMKGGDLASQLADAAGGLDKLQAASANYYQNFYSAAEQHDIALRQLGKQFEALGVVMPATRDEFRHLVESLDLITEGGRTTFAALMNLSGSFAAVVPAVEEISSSTSEMGRAMGDAARATEDLAAMARKAEDEARRASERAAQDAAQAIVKAAQDAASAASEAARKASEAHSKASAMTDRVFAELRKQFDKALQAARTMVDTAQAIAQMTGERSRALYGEIPESRQYGAAAGNAFIDDALRTMLQGGAMPKTDELSRAIDSAVAGLDVNNYASVAQFQADKAILAAKLGAMEKVAGKQLTEGEQQVELLQQQLEHWDEQLSVLRDTQVSVTSIDDGVRQLSGLMAAESAAAGAAREAQDRYAQASLALQQAQQAQQGAAQQPGSIAGAYNSAVADIRAASWYGNGDWGEARGLKLSELSTAIGVDAGDLARLLVQQGLSLHGDLITTRDAYGDHDAEAAAIRAAKWYGSGNWDDARGSSLIGLAKSMGVDPVDLERRLIAEGMQVSADGIVLSKRYAQGGLHSGGWRLVGEQGPEVEFTGPARYWSFDQSRSMLSGGGGGNEELIAENRALRAKVDQLIARLDRVAAATETSARLMDRVTANGNAMRTEAA